MKRSGKDWSELDITKLKGFAAVGASARSASKVLHRSRGACAFKAMSLGIRFHSLGRKHSRKQKARYSNG